MTVPNKALAQAGKDVPADSSTALDTAQANADAESTDPGPAAGNQSGDGPSEGKKSERSIDNVRGELLRKMEGDNASLKQELAKVTGMLEGMQAAPSAPSAAGPRTIDNMSAQELEGLKASATADQLPELERLIQSRYVSEQVKAGIQQELGSRDFADQRRSSNEQAYSRFPELHNTTGAFYKETNKVLGEMGKTADSSPRAVLDAANEAGVRLGLSPKAGSILLHQHDTGSNTAPAPTTKKAFGMSKDRRDEIASKLAGAMPKGKFNQDNLDSIDKNSAVYDEHRNLFIKR